MRLPLVLVLPLLILNILTDWYICRVVWKRALSHAKVARYVAVWSSVALSAAFIVLIILPKRSGSDTDFTVLIWTLFSYFSIYLAKYVFVLIDLVGKIPCLWGGRRLRAAQYVGIALGIVVFGAMWWGALVNRYIIDVKEVSVEVTGLPPSLDGFRVVQFSDLHVGTFGGDTAFVAKLVDRINSLKPDLIVFTGDIVNRHSSELEPFAATLSRLDSPEGVLSILGNHDYGDYYNWPSEQAKVADRKYLREQQSDMGWRMLNNDTYFVERPDGRLAVIGVENIGDPPFPVYGDLEAAYNGSLDDPTPKILLSHNPAHWEVEVMDKPDKNIFLTLAGHTHAMQISFGRVSPAAFRYDKWGGLYSDDSRHNLYVNIGAGEVGMPARIGATPEITVFTLHPAYE